MPKVNIVLSATITDRQLANMKKAGVTLGNVPEFRFTVNKGKESKKVSILTFEATEAYVSK